jgi:hypothetical protein
MAETTRIDWQELLTQALTAPGNLTGVYDRFHEYSITNCFLFMMQGVREPVASYKRWTSLGRHVIQGARAKEVIVPLLIPEKPPVDESLEEKRERVARLVGFKLVRGVFALSDTEGKDLPPAPVPGWDLQKALDKLGIREVPFEEMNGNVQGVSHGLNIAINPVAVNPNKTRFHEIAHVILGHTIAASFDEYVTHRGIREFEAEGTAYLCMNELDMLDEQTASRSRAYIQHWMQDETPPEKSIQRVFKAADAVLRAGRVTVAQASEQ